MFTTKRPLEERFVEKIREPFDAHNECWVWTGSKTKAGYGRLWVNEKNEKEYAHRLSYEFFAGPIPDDTEIDHLCHNPLCVRPDHLEAVSHAVNVQRGLGNQFKYRTHCKQGHPFDEVNTHHHPSGQRICRTCRAAAGRRYRLRRKEGK